MSSQRATDSGSHRWIKEPSYENLEVLRARTEMHEEIGKLRKEINDSHIELMQWLFGAFMFATMLGYIAIIAGISKH